MKEKIDSCKLKRIQLNILDYVANFCSQNGINYWLDCGTLLGAIRHNGYITWDDDIDIGMLREDYDKFIKIFNKIKNSNIKLHCYETDKNWYLPYGKILDESTLLYEPDEKSGVKSSINIDVFVYDNAPDNDNQLNKMFKLRDLYRNLNNLQKFKHFASDKNQIFNIIRLPIWLLFQLIPQGFFIQKSINNSKKFVNSNSRKVGNFTSISKQSCSKDVFNSFVKVNFEGKEYYAPIGYDKWLKSFYGDYMKLPPKEKQISHHKFVAYEIKGDD